MIRRSSWLATEVSKKRRKRRRRRKDRKKWASNRPRPKRRANNIEGKWQPIPFFFSRSISDFKTRKNKKQKPIPQLIFMLNRSKTNSSFVFVFLPCLFVVDQRSRLIVGHPLVFKLSTTVDRYFVIVIRRHFGFQYRFTSIHFCLYFHVSTLLDFFILYCSNSHLLFFSILFGTAILLFMLNASISIPDEGK